MTDKLCTRRYQQTDKTFVYQYRAGLPIQQTVRPVTTQLFDTYGTKQGRIAFQCQQVCAYFFATGGLNTQLAYPGIQYG